MFQHGGKNRLFTLPVDAIDRQRRNTRRGLWYGCAAFRRLKEILAGLTIAKTGHAFMIDRKGSMLSSSTKEPLTVGKGENAKLVMAQYAWVKTVPETKRCEKQTLRLLREDARNDKKILTEPYWVMAIQSEEPIVRETAQYLQRRFGSFDRIQQSQQVDYLLNNRRQFVQLWLIVGR